MRLPGNGLKPTFFLKFDKKCKTSGFHKNLVIAWMLGFLKNPKNDQ